MTKVVALKKEARSTKKASSKKVVKAVAKEKATKIKLAGFAAELVLNGNELTYDDITSFVRTEVGGNENNVEVTALVDKPEDVPFGWGGKKGGEVKKVGYEISYKKPSSQGTMVING